MKDRKVIYIDEYVSRKTRENEERKALKRLLSKVIKVMKKEAEKIL
ncbi:hypothetical protein JWYL7_0010 [Alkalithermobacter thermoalcaliphilus JW-YL-7 = DSM 7308]|uniref:Uncharacterized protein n=1 Tax=Alkalithermobacter thermoalcaliphilus JW-YL-7 = DSM 7308 TaxID=1121328 RepID=A0A150FMY1_CLOPD|nr:hypothetical protein JWYL7_0010 [[Clostridium] paradoxum JW-YL-7 = DSM 7308]